MNIHSRTSFRIQVDADTVDLLLRDGATAERGKPQGPPAVAGVNQRLRVRLPGWLYVIAIRVRESAGLAAVQVTQPKVPVAAL